MKELSQIYASAIIASSGNFSSPGARDEFARKMVSGYILMMREIDEPQWANVPLPDDKSPL